MNGKKVVVWHDSPAVISCDLVSIAAKAAVFLHRRLYLKLTCAN